jgi:hypothetical protein
MWGKFTPGRLHRSESAFDRGCADPVSGCGFRQPRALLGGELRELIHEIELALPGERGYALRSIAPRLSSMTGLTAFFV